MSNVIDITERLPTNVVFEASDSEDSTKTYHFEAHRDESDTGVYLNFVDNHVFADGSSTVRDMMWIDPDQCEKFGRALLSAAAFCRNAIAMDLPE